MCSKCYSEVNIIKHNRNTISTVTLKAKDTLEVISLHRLYHTKPSHTHTHAHTENRHQRFKKAKLMIDFRGWMSRASQVNSSSAPYGQGCHFSFPPKGLDILVNIIENNNLMLPEAQLHHRDHASYRSVLYCLLYLIDKLNQFFPPSF